MTLVLRYAARSDRGLVRSNNQDSVYAGPRLLALADGMGGHAAGEVASKVVIGALASLDDDEPGDDLLGQLRDAVLGGNGAISELVASDPDLDGMGTTLTAVLFAGTRLGLVHIGDSRAYLLRDGVFTQITHDDTFVQSLIDEGRITPEEAANHPQRSLLLRALTGNDIEPSLAVREARAGDRYLLCSDGLSGPVSEETLGEAMRIPDPQACADRMIELALRGGGPDNVTCIVADVVNIDFGEDTPIVGGAAGDGSEDPPPPDSPASRAQAITAPRPQPQRPEAPPTPDPRARRRRAVRSALVTVLVLVLLAAGVLGGRFWVLRQYYVGSTADGRVVIFQGVRGSVLGLQLHKVVEGSCTPDSNASSCEEITLDALQPLARDIVRNGISTNITNLDDARTTLRRLRNERMLPPCPKTDPSQSTGPTTPTSPPPTGPPTTTAAPVSTTTTAALAEPTATDTTMSTTSSLKPGLECRKVG